MDPSARPGRFRLEDVPSPAPQPGMPSSSAAQPATPELPASPPPAKPAAPLLSSALPQQARRPNSVPFHPPPRPGSSARYAQRIEADIGLAGGPMNSRLDEDGGRYGPMDSHPFAQRHDGFFDDSGNPPRRVVENARNQFDPRWIDERMRNRGLLLKNPYYTAACQVAMRTGRKPEDLLEKLVPEYESEALAVWSRLEAISRPVPPPPAPPTVVPKPAAVPALKPPPPVAKPAAAGTSDPAVSVDVKPSIPGLNAPLDQPPRQASPPPPEPERTVFDNPNINYDSSNRFVDHRWLNQPENSGYLLFNHVMRGGISLAMTDIQQEVGNMQVTPHQLIVSPTAQDVFFNLVAAHIRLSETGTPRRPEARHLMLEAKKRRTVAIEKLRQLRLDPLDPSNGPVSLGKRAYSTVEGLQPRDVYNADIDPAVRMSVLGRTGDQRDEIARQLAAESALRNGL